jgi:hypothetical protein
MTGRRNFTGLEAEMPPARRARIGRLAEKLGDEMDLAQLSIAPFSDDDLIDTAERAACVAIEDYENISKSAHHPMPEYWITCRVASDLARKGAVVECETRIDGLITSEESRQGRVAAEKVDIVLYNSEDARGKRQIRALIEIKSCLSTWKSFPDAFERLRVLGQAIRAENMPGTEKVLVGLVYGTAPMSAASLDAECQKIEKLIGYPVRRYGRRRTAQRNSDDNWWEIMSIFQQA